MSNEASISQLVVASEQPVALDATHAAAPSATTDAQASAETRAAVRRGKPPTKAKRGNPAAKKKKKWADEDDFVYEDALAQEDPRGEAAEYRRLSGTKKSTRTRRTRAGAANDEEDGEQEELLPRVARSKRIKTYAHQDVPTMVQSAQSLLVNAPLTDVLTFENFDACIPPEEKDELLRFVSSVDCRSVSAVRDMFYTPFFRASIRDYQTKLASGVFDPKLQYLSKGTAQHESGKNPLEGEHIRGELVLAGSGSRYRANDGVREQVSFVELEKDAPREYANFVRPKNKVNYCRYCLRDFATAHTFVGHMIKYHGLTIDRETNEFTFYLDMWNKSVRTLWEHLGNDRYSEMFVVSDREEFERDTLMSLLRDVMDEEEDLQIVDGDKELLSKAEEEPKKLEDGLSGVVAADGIGIKHTVVDGLVDGDDGMMIIDGVKKRVE